MVIVVRGGLEREAYPHAYWGVLDGVGKKDTGLNYAFNETDRDNVEYFARPADKVTQVILRTAAKFTLPGAKVPSIAGTPQRKRKEAPRKKKRASTQKQRRG